MPAAGPIAIFSALEPELATLRAALESAAEMDLGASANGARVVRHLLPIL